MMTIKRKTYSELIEEIKQRMRESLLVRNFVYFRIICSFLEFGLLVLFLFYVLAMKLNFLISLLLAIIISFVSILIFLWEFFLYRNPRVKLNWIITPIWNFLDGKHLKYDMVTRNIMGGIFVIIFTIFIFFSYTKGAFQNPNEQRILSVVVLIIISALIVGVIDLIFSLKRIREVKKF